MIVETIIKNALPYIGQPQSPIASDMLSVALAFYNTEAENVWQSWPFDEEKIDEFQAPAPVNGIITFDTTVDIIRAIRVTDGSDSSIYSGGEYMRQGDDELANRVGIQIANNTYHYLSDDTTTGAKRIRVATTDADTSGNTYHVLALKRFVPAIEDANYDSGDPTATPTDYRVQEFGIDRALSAVQEFLIDDLRDFVGMQPRNKGAGLLALATDREHNQQAREKRFIPGSPMFGDHRFSGRRYRNGGQL